MADMEYKNGALCLDKLDVNGNIIENIQDPEGRIEIKTDPENKILSYRDKTGVLHEYAGIKSNNIETNFFSLSYEGMTEFQKALKNNGFKPGGAGDFSDYISGDGDNPLVLPEPRCAIVNLILPDENLIFKLLKEGIDGAIEGINYNVPFTIEYYDTAGNYFKKPALISAQGQSTLYQLKRNLSIDLFDISVYNSKGKLGKGDAFKVKIGDWVGQDSFHLKGYYSDILKCRGVAAYKVYKDMCRTKGIYKDYIWKRGLIDVDSIPYMYTDLPADPAIFKNELYTEFESGATCIPDGFPVLLYVCGKFFGCYSWQLKKHRDNYKLKKSNSNHVWIDSTASSIWLMNGNLDWSKLLNLEVRNPKDLYVKNRNGKIVKYNVDLEDNVGEFIDSSMEGFDSSNPDHVRTEEVKNVLIDMSTILPALLTAEKPCVIAMTVTTYWEYIGTVTEVSGIEYEDYIPTKVDYSANDYVLYQNHVFRAKSGMPAGTLPIDNSLPCEASDIANVKSMFEASFDVENLVDYQIISQFMQHWDNWGNNWQWITYNGSMWYCSLYDCDQVMNVSPKNTFDGKYMFYILIRFYKNELVERYNELKNLGILSRDRVILYIQRYLHTWGEEYFKKDVERWGYTRPDTMLRIAKWLDKNIQTMNSLYI